MNNVRNTFMNHPVSVKVNRDISEQPISFPSVRPITLPEQAIEPVRMPGATEGPTAGLPLARLLNPINSIKATLTVRLGSATLTVGELLGAQQNQVLVLDQAVDQPVDILLEGQVVARGQLVAMDDHFAVRITELPISLNLREAGSKDMAA